MYKEKCFAFVKKKKAVTGNFFPLNDTCPKVQCLTSYSICLLHITQIICKYTLLQMCFQFWVVDRSFLYYFQPLFFQCFLQKIVIIFQPLLFIKRFQKEKPNLILYLMEGVHPQMILNYNITAIISLKWSFLPLVFSC